MSLIDIVKSGKNANMTRIEYANATGMIKYKEFVKRNNRLDFELSINDIIIILNESAKGKRYGGISTVLLVNHPHIKRGTMQNRVVEALKYRHLAQNDIEGSAHLILRKLKENHTF